MPPLPPNSWATPQEIRDSAAQLQLAQERRRKETEDAEFRYLQEVMGVAGTGRLFLDETILRASRGDLSNLSARASRLFIGDLVRAGKLAATINLPRVVAILETVIDDFQALQNKARQAPLTPSVVVGKLKQIKQALGSVQTAWKAQKGYGRFGRALNILRQQPKSVLAYLNQSTALRKPNSTLIEILLSDYEGMLRSARELQREIAPLVEQAKQDRAAQNYVTANRALTKAIDALTLLISVSRKLTVQGVDMKTWRTYFIGTVQAMNVLHREYALIDDALSGLVGL